MPRSRYDDDDDYDGRPLRRRRRGEEDHDPGHRHGGGLPVGVVVGGVVALVLLVIGGVVLAVTSRKPAAPPEAAKAGDPAPAPVAVARPNPFAAPEARPNPLPIPEVRPNPFPAPDGGPQPALKLAPGTAMPAEAPSPRQIVFAGGTDGVVGLVGYGSGADQLLTVARTKTGEKLGQVTIPSKDSPNGYAVAPGGKYAAAWISVPFDGDAVVLYDLRSGHSYRFTPYSRKAAITNPNLIGIGFAGPDRLLTVHETSGFDVWQLPGMKRVCGQPGRPPSSVPFVGTNAFSQRPTNFSLAADGKTFAVFDGTGFSFYDTATAARKARTEQVVQGLSANFYGAAFTADGSRFASLCTVYQPQSVTALLVWDAATGRRLTTTTIARGGSGTGLSWWGPNHVVLSQGGSGSAQVVSVASGEVVAQVETDISGGVQFIAPDTPGDSMYYTFDRSRRAGGRDGPVLAAVPAPATLPGTTLTLGPDGPRWR